MNDTTAMVLTGPGAAAIAVVLLNGPRARAAAAALSEKAGALTLGQATHANLHHAGQMLDDAVVVCLQDTRFELHLHGGRAVIQGVMNALTALGAPPAKTQNQAAQAWPEETPIGREVMEALRETLTPTAVQLLAAQRETGLTAWTQDLLQQVKNQQPLWKSQSAVQWLLTRSMELQRLLSPARVALIGPPNAGKSTLANALLGRPVSITSDQPGTTRDWVDATALFTTGPVRVAVTLVDTAGMRDTHDAIENESIARTHAQAATADLVLAAVDHSAPPRDLAWLQRLDANIPRMIVVQNKCDAGNALWEMPIARPCVRVSGKTHENLDALMHAALASLGVANVNIHEPFAFTPRQLDHLHTAAKAVNHAALAAALRALMEGAEHE